MESINHTLETVKEVSELKPSGNGGQAGGGGQAGESESTISIHTSPSMSMLLDLELPIARLKSNNEERVLEALKPRPPTQPSRLERQICIEDVCFHAVREKDEAHEHDGHRTVKYSALVRELEVLRCNQRLARADPQQAIDLLDGVDRIYHEIVCFEDEIARLFQQVKQDALRHISTVKQSFADEHYERVREQLRQRFDFANVRYALAEIERFRLVEYPYLEYPRFKVGSMEKRIGLANVSNKLIGVEAINSWIQRLYALEKKDRRVLYNRSIASFLNKSPCERLLFSHYLRAPDYAVANSKALRRPSALSENVPFAVVEKEVLPGTEVKFRVGSLGKGMFIGVSTLEAIESNHCENLVEKEGSYYLSSRGDILPLDQDKRRPTARMGFSTGDEIVLKRERNTLIWRRRREDKSEQEVRLTLSITEYAQNFYPCVHLEDTQGVLELID